MNNNPIGIFDSGLGGLTVASAIKQLLPDESIIYFGDTAHLPYGDKSQELIMGYSLKIADFLLEHGVKVILIACNSATASAYDTLKEALGKKTIIIDVINPVINYVASLNYSKVAVIGTKRTISSGTYESKLKEIAPNIQITSIATPLLAPMIEEGFIYDDISNAILRKYLSDDRLKDIEALILGCTHYPIIKNQINKIFDFRTDIIDSSQIVANLLKKQLEKHDMLSDGINRDHNCFFVSDYTPYFEKMAKMFFNGTTINIQKNDIWK